MALLTELLESIPAFDGSEKTLEIFFESLDRVAQYAQWSEKDRLFVLSSKLQGEAAKFFQQNISKRGLTGYSQIKAALIDRFKKGELPRQFLRKLCLAFQKPGDTVRDYASQVEALSFKAFNSLCNSLGGEEARKETLMGAFVDGLKPSLRRVVHHLGPRTFEEAVKLAVEEEELFERPVDVSLGISESTAVNVSVANSDPNVALFKAQQEILTQLTSTVTELTNRINVLSIERANENSRTRTQRRVRTCFGCNQAGHVKRVCPDRINVISPSSVGSEEPVTCSVSVPLCSVNDATPYALPIIDINFNNIIIPCLIDTGAAINLISAEVVNEMKNVNFEPCNLVVQGISDSPHVIKEKCILTGCFGNDALSLEFFVTPLPLSNNYKAILSFTFLQAHSFVIDTPNFSLKNKNVQIPFRRKPNIPSHSPVSCNPVVGKLKQKIKLDPFSETIAHVHIPVNSFNPNSLVLAESAVSNDKYLISRSVSHVCNNSLPIKILNLTSNPIHLNKNSTLVSVQPVSVCPPPATCSLADPTNKFENDFEAWGGGDVDLSHLPEKERQAVQELLHRYPRLFATSVKDLEGCNTLHHRVELRDSVPVRQKPYKVPYHLRGEMDRQIHELLEANIIEESDSPYSAPVLFVRKSDGTYRLVTDFRKLNEKTVEDNFPLPNMTEMIDNLAGAEYFTSLDLTSGYFQMPVHPDDVYKCAFSTYNGHFQWRRVAFGLRNAPSSFQRLMQLVLAGLLPFKIATYLDDIVVASETFEEHLERLAMVFDRLTAHHLRLKPSKCKIAKSEIEYLGFKVSKGIVAPLESNLKVVEAFKTPTTRKEVRQFLGVTGFYRRFIKNYAKIALPLTHLTKDNIKFFWGAEAQESFSALKAELLAQPVLALPDFTKDFVLCTDASKLALGAVLSQEDSNGHLHPVAYASRKLKDAETRYSVVEKEALAVVWGVSHFRQYLLGRPFLVYCDQASLSHVFKLKDPTSRIARWNMTLAQYQFTIKYLPGKLNFTADYLSRAVNSVNTSQIETSVEPSLQQRIKNEQETDVICDRIRKCLQDGDPPEPRKFLFFLKDDILFCTNRKPRNRREKFERIVVPKALTAEIIDFCHNDPTSAHPGIAKTLSRARQQFFWPGMYAQIQRHVLNCFACVGRRGHVKNPPAPLQRIPVAQRPLERVAVDVIGPLALSLAGNKYLVVATDYFTRYPEAYPVPDIKTLTIVEVLEKFISTHGTPEILLSDRGKSFLSDAIDIVYKKLGIKKVNTSSYHPQTDGVCERLNGVLINSLSHLVEKTGNDWCRHVPFALLAHRTSVHASTGESPAFLMYGRDLTLPVQLLSSPPQRSYSEVREYVDDLHIRLQTAFRTVKENLEKAASRQELHFSKKAKLKNIKVGDTVFCYFPKVRLGESNKFASKNRGPFSVTKQTSPVNFEIELKSSPGKKFLVHVNRLRKVAAQEVESIGAESPVVRSDNETISADINPHPYNLRPRDNHGFVISG